MRLAKSVKFREEKFGGVLFETRSEKVFTLKPHRGRSRPGDPGRRPENEIAPRLEGRFEGGEGVIEKEVEAFIAALRQQGLTDE